MELSKTPSIEIDYKDRDTSLHWERFTFSEIVFIDKAHPTAPPILYQFKDSDFSLNDKNNFWKTPLKELLKEDISRETFIHIGEVVSINRQKKHILLSNKNIVAYTYLIIASSNKPVLAIQDNEFAAGVQTLSDALRVKPKIPSAFSSVFQEANHCTSRSKTISSIYSLLSSDIQKIQSFMLSNAYRSAELDLHMANHRLYEIQL